MNLLKVAVFAFVLLYPTDTVSDTPTEQEDPPLGMATVGEALLPVAAHKTPETTTLAVQGDWHGLLRQYDWDEQTAHAVMLAESNGDPSAFNPEWHSTCQGSIGLFQVACLHDDPDRLYSARHNVAVAHGIWQREGWRPWGVCTDGKVNCGI